MRSTSMRKSIVLTVAEAEQDNRMITNAGATAAQNENIMHTGCYAGERENFMRENLFMTETTMAPVKIALDHGWSSIKGEHIFMETSVVPVDYTPLTNHVEALDNELAADTSAKMDNSTKSMLGSLFDMDDD